MKKDKHKKVKHLDERVALDGTNINANESFHWMIKASLRGVYVGGGIRYTQSYHDELAWRRDHVRVTPAEQFAIILHATLTTPRSRLTNYWQRGNRRGQRAKSARSDYSVLTASKRNEEVYRRPDRLIRLRDVVATLRGDLEAGGRLQRQIEAVAAAKRLGRQAPSSTVVVARPVEPVLLRRPRRRGARSDDGRG